MPVVEPRRRPPALLAGALAAALLVGAGTGAGAAAAPAAPPGEGTVGSSGLGDPYFPLHGNGGYDVRHYAVDARYEVATGRIAGSTVLTAVATQPLSRFNVDLVLTVDEVLVDGVPAGFSRRGAREVQVTPATPLAQGDRFEVEVRHHGRPERIRQGGPSPWLREGEETMATNEPRIAPWWFAANDHPRDRARFDVRVAVPEGYQVVGNGDLVESPTVDGWTTWHWRLEQPVAPYLAFFAAGRFEIESGTELGLPFVNAVSMRLGEPLRERAMSLMGRTPEAVRWAEGHFGDYPYTTTGGVTTSLLSGFALENASRPTYPYLGDGELGQRIVVHEVAHQWFGNHVSVGRWRDIWLNEGFATWAEWRHAEDHGGSTAQQALLRSYDQHGPGDSFWDLEVGDPGPRHLFHPAVYDRGAMAVQALRHRIGEQDFTRLLHTWLERRGRGTGTVPQFRRMAGEVSGERLAGFFRAWLATPAKPAPTVANGLRDR